MNITAAQQKMLDELKVKGKMVRNNSTFKDWLIAGALIRKGIVKGDYGEYEHPVSLDYNTGAIGYRCDYWYEMEII